MLHGAWKLVLLAAVVVAAVASSAVAASTRPAGSVVALSPLESGVLVDVNQARRAHGLAPLHLSAALTAASRQHSRSMAAGGYFGHDSADGSAFWKRILHYYAQGRHRYWSVGENLLWSSPDVDADSALKLWLASPPHRENLLAARWREIGISAVQVDSAPGTYSNQPVTIVTTDFGVRR